MTSKIIIKPLTTEKAFEHFSIILKTGERHLSVRKAVVTGISNQLSRLSDKTDFKESASHLHKLLNKLTHDEINDIVETLTHIYLKQREYLKGGDEEIEVNRHRYRIWVDSQRPQTGIEEVILQWLGNDKYPIVQQVAMQAKVKFASALDQEEEKRIAEILEQRGCSKAQSDTHLDTPLTGQARRFPLDGIVAAVATIFAKPYRPVIRNVLPEALEQNKSRRDAMSFVLRSWRDDTNKEKQIANNLKLGTTSNRLGFGLHLAENPLWLVSGLLTPVGIVAVSLNTLHQQISRLSEVIDRNPPPPPQPTLSPLPDDGGISVLPGAIVKDMDSANFDMGKFTVEFSSNGTPDDHLSIPNQGKNPGEIGVEGNNVTYGGENIGHFEGSEGTKSLVVSFNDKSTQEAVQALLRNIKYKNVSEKPVIGSRTVKFQLSDGGENGTSKSLTKVINVTTENQAPALKVPDAKTVKENANLTISGISISDPDSQKLTITLSVINGILTVKPDVAKGLTAKNISNNKTKTVTLTGTIEQIENTLADPKSITYQGDKDFSGEDSLTVTVNDNGKAVPGVSAKSLVWPPKAFHSKTEKQNISITVTPLKALPSITVPDGKMVKENTNLPISGISISDPNSQNLLVTLEVSRGTLSVKNNMAKGLTAKDITENGKKTVTLKGTIAQINKTLADPNAIIYRGDKDFNGKDSLSVTVNNGGKKPSSKSISITVTHLNQPPVISESEALSTDSGISITNEEAVNLINIYLQAKEKIFGLTYDRQLAASLFTSEAYKQRIINLEGGSLEWLKQHNNYYRYGFRKAKFIGNFYATGEQVKIDVHIFEKLTYYEAGKPPVPKTNDQDYRFTLKQENGTWKIADIQPLNVDGE